MVLTRSSSKKNGAGAEQPLQLFFRPPQPSTEVGGNFDPLLRATFWFGSERASLLVFFRFLKEGNSLWGWF